MTDHPTIEEFHADRFICHADCQRIFDNLEHILRLARTRNRPSNLHISGDAGSGKSTVLRAFFEHHKERSLAQSDGIPSNAVVLIDMPPEPTPTKFLNAISRATNTPGTTTSGLGRFAVNSERIGMRLIMIDEFQRIDHSSGGTLAAMIDLINWIGDEPRMAIAITGTKSVDLIVQKDQQLRQRFKSVHLRNWIDDEEFETFVLSYLHALPIELPDSFNSALFDELLKIPRGRTQDIVETLCQASFEAHRSNDLGNLHIYVRDVRGRDGYVD